MSFLAKLFKPKTPETLEQKIVKLDDSPAETVISIATGGESEPLRLAAIQKLEDADTLISLGKSEQNNVAKAARKRLGSLIDDNKLNFNTLQSQLSDQKTLFELCAYSSSAGQRFVDNTNDEAALIDFTLNGPTTLLRQSAAKKVDSYDGLSQIQRQIKNKDKTVYRIVKQKLEGFKEEKQKQQEREEFIAGICVQLENLAKRKMDDIFHVRLQQIRSEWADNESDATQALMARWAQASQVIQAQLDEIEQEKKRAQEAIEADKAAKKEIYTELEKLTLQLQNLFIADDIATANADIDATSTQLAAAIQEAQSRQLNTKSEQAQFDKLQKQRTEINTQLSEQPKVSELVATLEADDSEKQQFASRRLKKTLAVAKALFGKTERPEWLQLADKQLQAYLAASKAAAEKSKAKLAEVNELLRKGKWAADKGHVGRSRAILRDLETGLKDVQALPSHIESRVEDLQASIAKLGDWHEFAVTPKKEKLVQDMQALVGSPLDPQTLAKKIKQLQQKWRELAKGGNLEEDPLWEAFHAASNEAYEPCKQHFDAEQAEREQNLANRKQLIEQMATYNQAYDWESANWKDVEKTLRLAREAWQSYWPIPRKEIDDIQKTFDVEMDKVYEKLSAYYEDNKRKKTHLISQAEELSKQADTQSAIDKAKQLQSLWKAIGQCRRKDDQELWKQFRVHCDTIFDRRQQENQAEQTQREQQLSQAEGIIQQITDISEQSGDAFWEARSTIDKLTEAFQDIGELPRQKVKEVQTKYQQALKAVDDKFAYEKHAKNRAMWQSIFDALADAGTEEAPKCPAPIRDALLKRKDNGIDASTDALLAMRELCVESEVINGLETPEEDKGIKMQWQVSRLKKGLGQMPDANEDTLIRYVSEWVAKADVKTTNYNELERRFRACWSLC